VITRSGAGACVRASWLQVDPAGIDRLIDVYKTTSLPTIEDLEGFCSASLLVDHAPGRAVSQWAYDSIDAMRRNREQAATVRSTGTQQAGAKIPRCAGVRVGTGSPAGARDGLTAGLAQHISET